MWRMDYYVYLTKSLLPRWNLATFATKCDVIAKFFHIPHKEKVVIYFWEEDEFPHVYGFDDMIPVAIYGGKMQIDFSVASCKLAKINWLFFWRKLSYDE